MKLIALAALVPVLFAQQRTPLFHEDFESGSADPKVWTQQVTGDNVLKVQQDKAGHGKFALMVHCPANTQRTYAFLTADKMPEALRQHHFGRAYVYVEGKLPARHTIMITAGTRGFPKYKYEEVATVRGKFQLTYVDQINNGEDYHSGGADIPLGKWFCLEWEFNDSPNSATVWVDGEKIYESGFTYKDAGNTGLVGGFASAAFGFRLWGMAPDAFDIYYDDIALDTQRIGPITAAVR